MSDKKISELPAVTALNDNDSTPLVQGSLALAETRRATVAQLRAGILTERALHVRDFGAVGDGITDDAAAIQAALNAAAAQGGGTVQLGPRRYRVAASELDVKDGVFLQGRPGPGGWRKNGDYSGVRYALLLNPARTVRVRRNAGVSGIALLREGLTSPATLRQGLDAAAAFAGTAITVGDGGSGNTDGNGADAMLTRLLILGFNWGIYSEGNARLRVADVLGDCTNGIHLSRSYDVSRISEVNFHPLVTTSRSWSNTRLLISAVASNGAGQVRITTATAHGLVSGDMVNIAEVRNSGASGLYGRWTIAMVDSTKFDLIGSSYAAGWTSGGMVYVNANRRLGSAYVVADCDMASFENCFEYGHDIGFDVQDAVHSCSFFNIGADGWVDMADPVPLGIRIAGTALRTKWVGGFLSSKACSIQVNTTGSEQHEVIGVNVTGGGRRIAEVLGGQLSLIGCDFTGAPGTGNVTISAIHLGSGAGNLIVAGCDTTAVTFTADNAAAMQKLQLLGNRMTGTAGTQRIAAGRVELASVSSAAAIETRLSADTDGAVNIHRRSATLGGQVKLFNTSNNSAASFTISGADCVFAGDTGNPNAGFTFGGSGMTAPQTVRLRRLSATPAGSDRIGVLESTGNNSGGTEQVYARLVTLAENVAAGSEAGAVVLETRSGGSIAERFRLAANGTVTLSGPLLLPGNPATGLQAAPKQYVDSQFTDRRLATLPLSGATTISHAAHNNRVLLANPGTALNLAWASTLDGFSCTVINRTGADLSMALSGFTSNTAPTSSDGFTRIRAGGVATLMVYSPDGGTTKICHLAGGGAP
ncbi:glycosyl hydrolase family 28-related protein [Teichococcus oryzae]|uniref:glycosyl hydrolase family 28-related protein n=1 Tax=Teichococcus oryzae TaxID=1608942 RepID=UPI00157500A2|nr:glycosyl hydrolase family 28-related protein [Pseudoroseomonas oryzae]